MTLYEYWPRADLVVYNLHRHISNKIGEVSCIEMGTSLRAAPPNLKWGDKVNSRAERAKNFCLFIPPLFALWGGQKYTEGASEGTCTSTPWSAVH